MAPTEGLVAGWSSSPAELSSSSLSCLLSPCSGESSLSSITPPESFLVDDWFSSEGAPWYSNDKLIFA